MKKIDKLTERDISGQAYIPECFTRCGGAGSSAKCDECDITERIFETLASYEETGLTPEQIREMDTLYAEKCKELTEMQNRVEIISHCKGDCRSCEVGIICAAMRK